MATFLTFGNIVAVGLGAAFGAIARWLLGLWLNHAGAFMPWGTLAANFIGAYAIGLLLGVLMHYAASPEWLRLFLITGMLGGLTTFSTFSAETVGLISRGEYFSAMGYTLISVAGSLGLTFFGLWSTQRLF
jgi:CrcB protein